MMVIDIFCPRCSELILDQPSCTACGWQRPVEGDAPGSQVWRSDLGTRLIKPCCYPVIATGLYCLATEGGTLLALDADSGKVKWERPLGEGTMTHALASDGSRLFVACEDVHPIPAEGKALLALEAATGKELWQFPTQARSLSAPTVEAGTVYFTASDGLLYAVDATSGKKHWAVAHPAWGPAAPAVGEGVVCTGGRGTALVANTAADGKELWCFAGGAWFAARPCLGNGQVYALCWDDHLYALDVRTGKLLWKRKGERSKGFTSPPMLEGPRVCIGCRVNPEPDRQPSSGYALLALRAEDGSELWRRHTGKHVLVPPTLAEGILFLASSDGAFRALDATSGQELWCAEIKSQPVTQPCVFQDAVYFGGRDGVIHALRWRARPAEKTLAPSTYARRGDHAGAATAHALRGQFGEAAAVYEERLGKPREAARLYERAGMAAKAAGLWERVGELGRAGDLHRQAGDSTALARVLEAMNEPLQAGRLHEELGNLGDAARLYERGGDRSKAAEVYGRLGDLSKAWTLWESLGQWERLVDLLIGEGDSAEAARILEQHGELERAVDLYEQAGDLSKALSLHGRLGHWSKVAELSFRAGDYEQEAQAEERLEHHKRAAEAYERAATKLCSAQPLDELRVAALYEQAVRLFEEAFDDERSTSCRSQVRRYRRLPEVVARVEAEDTFVEFEWNTLRVAVENRGHGPARGIDISLRGKFDVEGEAVVAGLQPNTRKSLRLFARPHEKQYGPAVPLEVTVTYEDVRGGRYQGTERVPVPVAQKGILARTGTPLQITVQGDLVESGGRKDEQKGDRVELHRNTGRADRGISLECGQGDGTAQVRRGASRARRCPACNLPVEDSQYTHCPDCGAPLQREDSQ